CSCSSSRPPTPGRRRPPPPSRRRPRPRAGNRAAASGAPTRAGSLGAARAATGETMWTWNSDPSVVLGIGALSALYFLAAGRWRARLGGPPAPDRRRLWLFAAAMATLILALMSPIETLADTRSFMVHVFQHMLLTLVFPPLLIAATPPWMLRPLLRPARVMALARVLTRPLPAYLGFNVVFAVAHVPVVFNLVQASEARHAVEHLLFIATAVLMWWPILSPLPELPRLPYLGQLLYLFVQTLVGGVLIGRWSPCHRARSTTCTPAAPGPGAGRR